MVFDALVELRSFHLINICDLVMTPGCFSVVPPIGFTCCMHYNRYKLT
jgi:hypothetical protein